MAGRKKHVYALYKGDELLSMGTKEEISKELGIKKETLNFYTSRAYKEKILNRKHTCRTGYRTIINLGTEEELGVD